MRWAWLVVGCLAAVATACEESGNDSRQPVLEVNGGAEAAGGAAEAAGGDSPGDAGQGEGGDAGGTTSLRADTPAEACVAYAVAVCQRWAECRGANGDDCIDSSATVCPDLTASPGSTRTVEDLRACAQIYETWPCERLEAEVYPPCVTPGELQQGEPCVFASQCSSLNCVVGESGCGRCVREVGAGESCADDDVACDVNSFCAEGDVCKAIERGGTPPEVEMEPAAGPNEPCRHEQLEPCVEGYYCGYDEKPVCEPLPTLGEHCAHGNCARGLYCVEDVEGRRLVCVDVPGPGAPCGAPPVYTGEPYICEAGLLCRFDSPGEGTCSPAPEAGEPCNIVPSNPDRGECADRLHCNFTVNPPTCGKLNEAGEPCLNRADCQPELSCVCPEGELDCEERRCLRIKYSGEPCGDDTESTCHAAFDCKSGACQPGELRGTYRGACGG